MFNNKEIKIIDRLVCLLTFILVILFIDNLYTLIILGLFIFSLVKFDDHFKRLFLIIFMLIGVILGYFYYNFILLRISLIIGFIVYFFYDYQKNGKCEIIYHNDDIYDKIYKRNEKKYNKIKKGELIDKEIIKDKTISDYNELKNNINFSFSSLKSISSLEISYVTLHLLFLFVSIILGSCVI